MSASASSKTAFSSADGTLLLLLGLNLLLLAFFILLNSMATRGAHHAGDVLARVREGYNLQGSYQGPDADAPAQPRALWKQAVTGHVQGVVLNRLGLSTVPLEADANRVEVLIPPENLFDGTVLMDPSVVTAITQAAGAESRVTWALEGFLDAPDAAEKAAALASVGVRVSLQGSTGGMASPMVRVVVIPGETTASGRGGQVQRLGTAAGGTVQGVRYE